MAKGDVWILTGNTYPHRDLIKEIGGEWDPVRRAWTVRARTMRQRAVQSAIIHQLERKGVKVDLLR